MQIVGLSRLILFPLSFSFLFMQVGSFTRALRRPLFRKSYYNRHIMSKSEPSIFSRKTGPNTVVVVSGATSVGKSSVAMELCQRINGEIVISDSVQVYNNLDIGSNKPTLEDRRTIPHHLIDICPPSNTMSTGDFCRAASLVIKDILDRGKVPVLVGGSTMWIQWLVRGIPDAPKATPVIVEQADRMLKEFESTQRWDDAAEIVSHYDAVRVTKLARNDWYRLKRLLAIGLQLTSTAPIIEDPSSTGSSGATRERSSSGSLLDGTRRGNLPGMDIDFRTVFVSEDRTHLYHTIDRRCVDMLELGHISEVCHLLLEEVLRPEFPVSKSIGYRQTINLLAAGADGNTPPADITPTEFLEYLQLFTTATRNYAKRQLNWYRKDDSFLFVSMDRQSRSKETAYGHMAEEIWHWATVPREEFDLATTRQVQLNAALQELRSRKHVSATYLPDTEAKRTALSYLLHSGEFHLPRAADVAPAEKKAPKRRRSKADHLQQPDECDAEKVSMNAATTISSSTVENGPVELQQWVTAIQDPALGVTPDAIAQYKPLWSAQGLDLRSSGESQNDRLKLFISRVLDPAELPRYTTLIAQANHCRQVLFAEKRELLQQFLAENKTAVAEREQGGATSGNVVS